MCAELQELAAESLSLLKDAIGDDRFPASFDLEVYGSIIGMFELNNLGRHMPAENIAVCHPGAVCLHCWNSMAKVECSTALYAGIDSPSPVPEYLEAIDDLSEADKAAVQPMLQPILASIDVCAEELKVEGTAFYALQSCINHSCQPNAHALRSDDHANSFAVILAKQDIPAGAEVTISYIDETLGFEERQLALQDYGFRCSCSLCQHKQ